MVQCSYTSALAALITSVFHSCMASLCYIYNSPRYNLLTRSSFITPLTIQCAYSGKVMPVWGWLLG